MRINRRVCGLAATLSIAMMAAGCGGEGGEEAVFLYFIHGYAGSAEMSINSNRGVVVTGVPFGERFGDDGSCGPNEECLPIRLERQLGSEWDVLLENMVQPVDVEKDLFSMYPHETGTMVLTRRSDVETVETTLLRHTQSISSDCTITFVNGLSTQNEYLAFANYSIVPEWYLDNIALAGFGNEAQTPFISECGALPTDDPTHMNLQRPNTIAEVMADPWFFYNCTAGSSGATDLEECQFHWAKPVVDDRSRVLVGGTFLSVLDSEEYYECIEGAISLRQPEDQMTPVFPGAEVDCPSEPITWDDVDLDFQAIQTCREYVWRQVDTLDPGTEDTLQSYMGPFVCDARFRVRNEGQDILFGPAGNDDLGRHGDGALIESEVSIPDGSSRFFVLLGRPVNPIVWQWDSSETFVDLESFPYFNEGGAYPEIGDYSD